MPYFLFDTALGACGVAWSDAGVTWVQLPEKTKRATKARLEEKAREPEVDANEAPGWVRDAAAKLTAHLGGKSQDLSRVPLDLSNATPFAAKVYRASQRIPPGKTSSRRELAHAVEAPGSARAVEKAIAANPFPLIVPCHRVEGGGAYGAVLEKVLAAEGLSLRRQTSTLVTTSPKLPFDPIEAERHLKEVDAVLGRHIERVGALRLSLEETHDTFGALAESIVYQQLTGKAAATIFGRVRALFPNGKVDPTNLATISDDDLRKAGLSGAKTASLRDLGARALAGEIPSLAELARMEDEAIIESLSKVRGVGRWTAEMILIFRLGRPDVLPVGDYGVKKGFAKLFHRGEKRDRLPTPAELTKRAERWRPYRSAASWYLWRALDTLG